MRAIADGTDLRFEQCLISPSVSEEGISPSDATIVNPYLRGTTNIQDSRHAVGSAPVALDRTWRSTDRLMAASGTIRCGWRTMTVAVAGGQTYGTGRRGQTGVAHWGHVRGIEEVLEPGAKYLSGEAGDTARTHMSSTMSARVCGLWGGQRPRVAAKTRAKTITRDGSPHGMGDG